MNERKIFLVMLLFILIFVGQSSTVDAATFKDIPPKSIAYEAIEEMAAKGIITGYADGTYRQQDKVTREQAATIIGRALDIEPSRNGYTAFQDLSSTSYAYPYIVELTNRGVFSKDAYFYPSRTLTRAEMAKILVLAFNLKGETHQTFQDVSKSSWAAPYIQTLTASGVTAGVGQNRFDPQGSVTRGQMAMFISRALQIAQPNNSKEQEESEDKLFEEEAAIEKQILEFTNAERKKAGLAPLTWADDLSDIARMKSMDMLTNNYFSHHSPSHGSPFEMMRSFGIQYTYAAENIASGYGGSAEAVMEGWMNSPGHRANILSESVTEMGIGVATNKTKSNEYYYTQMFIKRSPS